MPGIEVMNLDLRVVALHGLRPQSGSAHQARHAPPAHRPAGIDQAPIDARTPIAFLVHEKETFDFREKDPVLLRMYTLTATAPGIEPAGRHVIAPTQRGYTEPRALRVDEGERVAFRAEQNRMAFFRSSCSAWSKACACSSAWSCAISRAGPGGGAFGARPRNQPSRASLRHLDNMNGWISNAAATVLTCNPGC